MSDKLKIEQLVRNRLEDAELNPSDGTWNGIVRKLRWKQFLRFRPAKFNIYYAGAIILAGAALGILWLGDKAAPEPIDIQNEPVTKAPIEVLSEEISTELTPLKEDIENSNTSQSSEIHEIVEEEPSEESNNKPITALPEADLSRDPETTLTVAAVSPLDSELPEEPMPFTYFASSLQSGCAPLEVQFTNQSVNATSYRWTFGTGDESEQKEPVYLFKEAGRYTVTLTAKNQGGKVSVSRRVIEVLPQPVAVFQIEEGLEGTDNHVVLNLLNYSSSASGYSWFLMDAGGTNCSTWSSTELQPSVELKRITPNSKSVQLEVVSEHGCRDTANVDLPIRVESSEVKIKFATAFSPNPSGPGDGSFSPQSKRIDLFHPIYVEVPVEYRMRVFTRRGELVYETQEVFRGWDGYIHQEQAPGDVYVWMVEGKWANGLPFSYHGDVTLVRNQYW